MRLKLFRAAAIADAMAQVRRDLGPDAVILSSRKVSDGVEVTAALEDVPSVFSHSRNLALERGLAYHKVPEHMVDALTRDDLPKTLAANLCFGSISLTAGDRPVLFTGPPGAGKTLTVARLATRLVIGGIQPMVITTDGQRAGAAEQLAAFTRLLGIDLMVASQPIALARALARRPNGAPVLIDMPGSSPFDPNENQALAALMSTADARMAVVIPAGLDPDEAGDIASGFASIGADYLVITRMDVTRRIGCILSAAGAGLTLAEAGIGPGAANGLVPMTAELLSHRLLASPQNLECRHHG